jgi:D-sedoheptulose 7-phosphate isomerase
MLKYNYNAVVDGPIFKMIRYINQYKERLKSKIDEIDSAEINNIIKTLDNYNNTEKSIYIIGNGGSAATASHMQNDLGTGLKRLAGINLNVISLCDNISVLTAITNDTSYKNVFYYQINNRIKKDDLLIAISCSGNSENIIKAVEYSKSIGVTIIGMTGFDGGKLKELSDIKYHIPARYNEYGLVEDMHMILNHMLYAYYIEGDL